MTPLVELIFGLIKNRNQSLLCIMQGNTVFLKYYRSQGVDKFVFYYQNATDEVKQVLMSAQNSQRFDADIELILWPNPIPNIKFTDGRSPLPVEKNLHYRGQKLAINDCVLRESNRSKFVASVDFDELIFPTNGRNLLEFLIAKDRSDVGSFLFRSVLVHAGWMEYHKLTDINWIAAIKSLKRDSHIFSYHHRSKTVLKPNAVSSHYIHWVDKYRSPSYKTLNIDISDAIIYHIKAPKGEFQFVEHAVDMEQSFKDYLLRIDRFTFD